MEGRATSPASAARARRSARRLRARARRGWRGGERAWGSVEEYGSGRPGTKIPLDGVQAEAVSPAVSRGGAEERGSAERSRSGASARWRTVPLHPRPQESFHVVAVAVF